MLYLHALGHFHPETVLDNHFLSSLDIGVDVKWIEDRVGIIERRTTLPLEYLRQTRNQDPRAAAEAALTTPTQMSVHATELALERAGLSASNLGMIISGGCSPEMQIPADSSRIANALGIAATCFDLHSACSSFASQIHFLNQMRPEALPDYVLVVNSETFTRSIDYSDRRQAVLFGDAATAAIVSSRVPSPSVISETSFGSDPAGQHQITIPTGGHFAQEGHAVQIFAIRTTTDIVKKLQASVPPDGEPEAGVHRPSGKPAHAGKRLQANECCAGRSLRQRRLLWQLRRGGRTLRALTKMGRAAQLRDPHGGRGIGIGLGRNADYAQLADVLAPELKNPSDIVLGAFLLVQQSATSAAERYALGVTASLIGVVGSACASLRSSSKRTVLR